MGSSKWDLMYSQNPNVPDDIVPFSIADMEFLNAPEIVTGLQDHIAKYPLGYTFPWDSYCDSVIGWMKRHHNWEPKKNGWSTLQAS